MGKKKQIPVEELVVPPQDTRICGTICVCQMTAVLSSVAIVYLTVAIYMPTMREFQSGISENPVICTTIRNVTSQKCDWSSCSEWCLSKPGGGCAQIYVNIRNNGSTLLFQKCSDVFNKTCFGIDPENAKKYTCIRDECKWLTGTFNCTDGVCINITDAFRCEFRNTESPPLKCNQHRGKINCMAISGLNNCVRGECSRILKPYNCDRRCVDIPTRNKNVIVLSGDRTFLSQCETAAHLPGYTDNDAVPPSDSSISLRKEIWTEEQGQVLLTSCMNIVPHGPEEVLAMDCVNGSLLNKKVLFDYANFSMLYNLNAYSDTPLVPDDSVAPREHKLLIAKDSHLHINLQGCVNTLRGECEAFIRRYGKDGSDHNARARFRCYYATDIPQLAVVRFDLERTYKEFLVASVVPVVMLIVSCLTLLLCQKTVEVGDDAKMRFKKKSMKTLFPLHECELDSITDNRASNNELDNTAL
ncbi:uncharacterized protein LOC126893499 [Daktulosphaira vitifoliae]|uniref:uncharacterized protein LOC126893499 n=1 Tax=Daktulosphaira vitifoliae TaxID=58002 RepID=UPI0021A9E875|nr:uncharacterized protein LOC126893499 [Daktulosphaira vitifoliae]